MPRYVSGDGKVRYLERPFECSVLQPAYRQEGARKRGGGRVRRERGEGREDMTHHSRSHSAQGQASSVEQPPRAPGRQDGGGTVWDGKSRVPRTSVRKRREREMKAVRLQKSGSRRAGKLRSADRTWSTWSAVSNRTPRTGELRSAPSWQTIGIGLRAGKRALALGGARSQGHNTVLRGLAPRTGFPLNCRTPPLLGASNTYTRILSEGWRDRG